MQSAVLFFFVFNFCSEEWFGKGVFKMAKCFFGSFPLAILPLWVCLFFFFF